MRISVIIDISEIMFLFGEIPIKVHLGINYKVLFEIHKIFEIKHFDCILLLFLFLRFLKFFLKKLHHIEILVTHLHYQIVWQIDLILNSFCLIILIYLIQKLFKGLRFSIFFHKVVTNVLFLFFYRHVSDHYFFFHY